MGWLWVRALLSVRRWGTSHAPARACSQFSEYDFRDLLTGARSQVPLCWRPITCRLLSPSFESPSKLLPQGKPCVRTLLPEQIWREGLQQICPLPALLAVPSPKAHCPWHSLHHDRTTADTGDARCFKTSLSISKTLVGSQGQERPSPSPHHPTTALEPAPSMNLRDVPKLQRDAGLPNFPPSVHSPKGRVSDQGKARDDHSLCF